MTTKSTRVLSAIAFIALLRPCRELLVFLDSFCGIAFGIAPAKTPYTCLLLSVYDSYGPLIATVVDILLLLILAAVPTYLIYRYILQRDFQRICDDCASHKPLAWMLFILFTITTLGLPSITTRHVAMGDIEGDQLEFDIPAQTETADNETNTRPFSILQLKLCHPENERLIKNLLRDHGPLTEASLASADQLEGYTLLPIKRMGLITDACYVGDIAELSNQDVEAAMAQKDPMTGTHVIRVRLKPAAREKFATLTRAYMPGGTKNLADMGRRLAILLDFDLVSAPFIRDSIENGEFVIAGDFTEKQAAALAASIMPLDDLVE